jgi:hypothetical protein
MMRTRLAALTLFVALAFPAAARAATESHLDYAHTWAEPTLNSFAVWNGGDGVSFGIRRVSSPRLSFGLEALYDYYPREPFYSEPGVYLESGGGLGMSAATLAARITGSGHGGRAFVEAGLGFGVVHQSDSHFLDGADGSTVIEPGGTWGAGVLLVGAGVQSRPVAGSLRVEAGARYLAFVSRKSGLRDAPVRIGLAW